MTASTLPLPLSPLVGRERELRAIGGLLAASRLVTLTGAGGSGKSRLALEAALRAAAENPERAAWVELGPLADPTLLADQVATSLTLAAGPERSALDTLLAALRGREVLLVLDNCEHLIEACAGLAETLLRGCPALRILATSREPLAIAGERVWLVPPLSLPARGARMEAATLQSAEAVQLFAARARESNPGFRVTDENAAAVAAVCLRLDGLPLALELAAARTRVLPVEQLAQRLDDAFRLLTTGGRTSLPRQKTLRSTFDWSFDLLTREQQVLLHRLSVFAGSFSLAAVEEICSGGLVDSWDVLDALSALVDRSLVVLELDVDQARYRLLETVRQYGRERLETAGEAEEIRRRHAHFYLALAERLAPQLFAGPVDLVPWLEMQRAYDNLRAAGDWAAEGKEHREGPEELRGEQPSRVEIALRLCIALHWTWYFRGHFLEGWRRLESALARGAVADPRLRGQALSALGFLAVTRGVHGTARQAAEEGAALLRHAGDRTALVYSLAVLSAVAIIDDPQAAREAAEEATRLSADLPTTVLTAFVAHWRGVAAHARGARQPAREAFQATIAIGRSLGHAAAVAHAGYFLGRLEWEEGNREAAHRSLGESLTLHAATGNRWGIAHCLEQIGQMAVQEGDPARAAKILAGADRLREEIGSAITPRERDELERHLVRTRTELGEAAFEAAWREGRGLPLGPLLVLAQGGAPPPPAERPAPAGERGAPLARLRVSALGPFEARREGAAATEEGWSSTRTRELLVFLLLQPEGATKEEVGLALWPEASASQVRNSFHVTLHRLRSALRRADGVRLQGGRYSIDPARIEDFDVPRFEREVRGALQALRGRSGAESDPLAPLLASVALYRGELLQGEPAGEWHRERRARLHRLFLEGLAAAGSELERSGRRAEAAGVYRRWLAAQEESEEALAGLRRCLVAEGTPAPASPI